MADLGGQGQRPQPGGLAKGARGLMQQVAQPLAPGGIQRGPGSLGPVRLLRQARQAVRVEGADDVADGLHGATDEVGDGFGRVPAGTGQHNLGRRTRKALAERRAASTCLDSVEVNGRREIGVFMPIVYRRTTIPTTTHVETRAATCERQILVQGMPSYHSPTWTNGRAITVANVADAL